MADAFDEYYKKLLDARSMAQTPQAVSQGTVGDIDLSKASPAGNAAGGAFNMAGTSQATQAGLSQYGQRYQMSDAVSQAKDYLMGVMSSKPGDYSSSYAGQISSLYNQIMNRPEFKYDVNKDPLFQSYKNNYMQTGQRAMQDAVGTAAGLTGGYGNSWGATAGFQAYQWYLQQLNNAIPELEQRAFDKYQYYGDELRNSMNMSMALDQMEYGRYRDTVQDWMAERAFANTLYGQERNWDMADWQGLQDYYQNLAAMETSSYRQDRAEELDWAELAEKQRQYDNTLEFDRYKQLLDEAFRRDELGERSRWFDEELANKKYEYQDTKEYTIGRDAVKDEQWNKEYNQQEYWNQKNWDYGLERDAKQDAWNQKLYDQSEQHYQDTRADSQRQWDYNLERDAKQDAWNQKLYDQSEQHYQDTRADSQRQWEHMLEREGVEDTRYEDTTQYNREQAAITNALNQAELDALIDYRNSTLGLDREKFEFDKYYKMLQAEGLTGGSGGGSGNGGSNAQTETQTEPQNAGQTKPLNAVYMPELVDIARINAANNPALSNLGTPEGKSLLTEALEKDLKSQKGDMVTLPITPVAADGTINQGPLAQRTQPMPREQAEELISAMEDLNKQLGKQTSTTKKKTGTQNSTSTGAKSVMSTVDQIRYGTRKQN